MHQLTFGNTVYVMVNIAHNYSLSYYYFSYNILLMILIIIIIDLPARHRVQSYTFCGHMFDFRTLWHYCIDYRTFHCDFVVILKTAYYCGSSCYQQSDMKAKPSNL